MKVTRVVRYTALGRLLRERDLIGVQHAIPLYALEQDWYRRCGLRMSDLHCALDELDHAGGLVRETVSGAPAIALTDRGVLLMSMWGARGQLLSSLGSLSELPANVNTARVLAVARRRCRAREADDSAAEPIFNRRRLA